MSKTSKKTEVVSIRLTDEGSNMLSKLEYATGKSKSMIVEGYIRHDWEKNQNKYTKILNLQKGIK